MSAPGNPSSVPAQIAGYRVERVLAIGEMGTVYLVHSPTLPRREVLKVLSAELGTDDRRRAQFIHEADVTAGLEHPNIVRVFSRGEADAGQLWITMEYVDGTNADIALRDGQMTPARAVHIITEVARALDYAHSRGVVHHDIKPSNFLIGNMPDGHERVVLIDFGAALSADSRDGGADGPMIATLAYSAPEILTGDSVDGRADVYSLGCTLYRLLTGEHPFATDAGASATVHAHLDTTPPRPSDRLSWAGPELDTVIATALAKRPADRYRTAGDFAAAAAAASAATPLRPADPPTHRADPPPASVGPDADEQTGAAADFIGLLPHTRAVSHRRKLIAAGIAAATAVGAALWVGASSSPPPSGSPPRAAAPTSTATSTPSPDGLDRLRRLLPSGYPAGACTPTPPGGHQPVITCSTNTDPGGPRTATFTLAASPEALRATFDQLVQATSVVICPGNIQSPGPWRRIASPTVERGTVLCGLDAGRPRMVWTNHAELLVADVRSSGPNDPPMDQLYAWWGLHS